MRVCINIGHYKPMAEILMMLNLYSIRLITYVSIPDTHSARWRKHLFINKQSIYFIRNIRGAFCIRHTTYVFPSVDAGPRYIGNYWSDAYFDCHSLSFAGCLSFIVFRRGFSFSRLVLHVTGIVIICSYQLFRYQPTTTVSVIIILHRRFMRTRS